MKLMRKEGLSHTEAAAFASLPPAAPAETAREGDVAIEEYQDWIPSFAAAELDHLYGSMFASMPQFRACGMDDGAHAYIVREHGRIITLWLFQRNDNKVRVLNEGIRIKPAELTRFADHIFRSHPQVDVISVHAAICEPEDSGVQLPYPLQRYNCLEDIVLQLPASVEDYRASLGKSTRSYVNRSQQNPP